MNVWLTSRLFRSKSRSEPKENIPSKTTPHNSCSLLFADRARVTLQQSNENETMLLQCVDSEGQSSRAVQMSGKFHGAQSHQHTSQQNTKPEMQGNRWNIREKFQLWNKQQGNKPHPLVPHTVLLQQELEVIHLGKSLPSLCQIEKQLLISMKGGFSCAVQKTAN